MDTPKRILAWITTPSVVHGVLIGVALSLLTALTWQLSLARLVVVVLVVTAFSLAVGALLGTVLYRRLVSRAKSSFDKVTGSTLSQVLADAAISDSDERNDAFRDSLPAFGASLERLLGIGVQTAARFFAVGRLLAILGVIVSFSVFLATYLQVERLAEQNSVLRLQSLSTHQQVSVAMRSQIVNVETLATLAQELHALYAADNDHIDTVTAACSEASEDWRIALAEIVGKRSRNYENERACIRAASQFLDRRSANLEANRLLNQQISGGGIRMSVFTRDLTEQFTSQFSSGCNTDPMETAEIGRIWAAIDSLESAANGILEEIDREDERDVEFLSGPPEEAISNRIEEFLQLSRSEAVTVRALFETITASSSQIQEYLGKQQKACAERSRQLRETLDRIDAEYQQLLVES